MSSRRRRRTGGPLTAAGLVRFFEDVEARVRISPMAIIIIAIAASVLTLILNYVFRGVLLAPSG